MIKKSRVSLIIVVFAFAALAGTTASFTDPPIEGVFGSSNLGACVVGDPESLEEGCGEGGTYQCWVYLPSTDEMVPAYKWQSNSSTCARPFRKW